MNENRDPLPDRLFFACPRNGPPAVKLMAVVAHPDDAGLFCGGTLARHAARGDDVRIVHMTRGEYGGLEDAPEPLGERREAEARRAAEVLGARVSFLDFHDGRVVDSREHRRILVEELRRHAPDLLLTHVRNDVHPDHRHTGRLVTDASYMASLPRLKTEHPPHDPQNVYYFGTTAGAYEFQPDVYVDVTDHQTTRERAIRQHESQVAFLAEHGGLDAGIEDLVEDVRAEARVLGRRVRTRFAEGFTRLHGSAVSHLG